MAGTHLRVKEEGSSGWAAAYWLWLGLALLAFLLGLAVRLYDLTDPPLDFHPTRQLHSALIARGMYYQNLDDIPDWQRERAVDQWKAEGLIEPQIMERLTAFTYRFVGAPMLWVARLWAIFFWAVGGICLYFLARDLIGLQGASVAVTFFMLWPYAAIASRAFQPESLSVASFILALWLTNRWLHNPSILHAIAAGLTCGIAIYIKVTIVFLLAPAIAGLLLSTFSLKSALKNNQIWLIALLSIFPYAIYHLYGVYALNLLGEQYSLRFFPNLWLDPPFYLRWIGEMNSVIGLELFLLAFGAGLLLTKKQTFGMFVGFFVGYILYGFVFSYHISTHDYYHLPLMVPISLGLGIAFQTLFDAAFRRKRNIFHCVVIVSFLITFMILKAWDVRVTLKRNDYRAEPAFWESLGESLGHNAHVTGLLADYGYRLAYWGWITPSPWPSLQDIGLRKLAGEEFVFKEVVSSALQNQDFFVVTEMQEFEAQPELAQYLNDHYVKITESPSLIIFDLNQIKEGW